MLTRTGGAGGRRYDGYLQLENGSECKCYLRKFTKRHKRLETSGRTINCTGKLAYRRHKHHGGKMKEKFPNLEIVSFLSKRHSGITVSGLIWQDLTAQQRRSVLAADCSFRATMLKTDEDVFLDDFTVRQVSTLQVPIDIGNQADGIL